MKKLFHYIEDFWFLFFPHTCEACGTALYKNEGPVCFKCLYELPRTDYCSDPENPIVQLFTGRIKIEKANTDDGWNIVGIGLRKDPQSHWLLLLSESPKNLGNKHGFELGQSLGAKWGTQSSLKQIKNEIKNVKWEYGKTYHLKITLSKKIIEGVVSNAEEGVLATIAYELNDTSVNEGTPFMKCAGFETVFSNVAIDVPSANTP